MTYCTDEEPAPEEPPKTGVEQRKLECASADFEVCVTHVRRLT